MNISTDEKERTVTQAFGEILKERRIKKGFKQNELAEKIGVSRGHVSRWERGKVLPSGYLFIKIMQFLDIELCELIYLGKDGYPEDQNKELRNSVLSFNNVVQAFLSKLDIMSLSELEKTFSNVTEDEMDNSIEMLLKGAEALTKLKSIMKVLED